MGSGQVVKTSSPQSKLSGDPDWFLVPAFEVRIASGNLQGRRRDGDEAGLTKFSAENYGWVKIPRFGPL